MDEDTATRFVSSLVKSIQALCNGYIEFSSSIEVIGHIHLNIDRNLKFNYILTEEVSKSISEDATLFASHSYHSKPPSSLSGKDSDRSNSKPNRRKTHQVPRVDDSEPDPLIIRNLPKDTPSASSHSGGDDSQAGNFSSLQGSNTLLSMKPERQQAASTHVRDSPDRRKRSIVLPSNDTPSPAAAKRNRNSDSSSSSAVQKADFGVIEIKEEPEDDPPVCFEGSTSNLHSGHDIQTPDFSSVVMESLDRVGQIEGTQLLGAGEVMPLQQQQQQQQQPFPVMLHASPVVPLSGVPASSFIDPSPSTESQHIPSTSGETVTGRRVRKPTSKAVQTPYNFKSCRTKAAKKTAKKPAPAPAKKISGEASSSTTSASRRPKASTGKARMTGPMKKLSKTYSRKSGYRAYTEEDVLEAIELVHGGVPVIDAALKFGIPRATLFIRSRQGCKTHTGRCSEVFSRTHGGQGKKRQKNMQYTREAVDKAIQAVHAGMPVIDASILYGIPRASLFIRSAKGCPSHTGRCSTVFSNGKLRRTKAPQHKYQTLHTQASKIHNKEEGEESSTSFELLEGVPVVNPVTGEIITFKTEPEDEFLEHGTYAVSSLLEAESAQDTEVAVPQDTEVAVPGSVTSSGVVYGIQPVNVVVKIERLSDADH